MMNIVPILIIGGGAAGLMAGVAAARQGVPALILEKTTSVGSKLALSGGGRGNLSNVMLDNFTALPDGSADPFCSAEQALKLLRPLNQELPPRKIRSLFKELGVATYADPEGRVYPVGDKAADLTTALRQEVLKGGGKILTGQHVTEIFHEEHWIVRTDKEQFKAEAVIIATGGASYPQTGSSGEALAFFRQMDLNVSPFAPALTPLLLETPFPAELAGISLPEVTLSYQVKGQRRKLQRQRTGPILWQKKGLSGPVVLNSSAELYDTETFVPGSLHLNFLGQMTDEGFKEALREYGQQHPKRSVRRYLEEQLPERLAQFLWTTFTSHAGVAEDLTFANLAKTVLHSLSQYCLSYPLTPASPPPLRVAMASRGGLLVNEVNLRTMAIKSQTGLYVAGECIDLDFISGGFHLTFAFQSGWLAGKHAALEKRNH